MLVDKFTGMLNHSISWASNYFDIKPQKIHESPRAHWLRRARKLGSPLLATGLASINKKFFMGIEDSSLLAARIFNDRG
jgi:hypothetical protein